MNKVTVLIEGYAHPGENDSFVASPSCVLVESKGKKVLVDPGANQKNVLEALSKTNLTSKDIDLVFLTHYHPDHFLALRAFPHHDVLDGATLWSEDLEFEHSYTHIPDTEIQILKTPGHSPEHCSLLVETEDKGTICIAQDVFWWTDGNQKSDTIEDLMNLKDPFASDEIALTESRKKVLEVADWIIPGHGKMFKNPSK